MRDGARDKEEGRKDGKEKMHGDVGVCVSMCVCGTWGSVCVCVCVSADPRWSQNSTEHISPLGVFTHTLRYSALILPTAGSPEPQQDFCSAAALTWSPPRRSERPRYRSFSSNSAARASPGLHLSASGQILASEFRQKVELGRVGENVQLSS